MEQQIETYNGVLLKCNLEIYLKKLTITIYRTKLYHQQFLLKGRKVWKHYKTRN